MRGGCLVAAFVLCVARPAAAQEPSLEAALVHLRGEALAARAEFARRKDTSSEDLLRLAAELEKSSGEARRLRGVLADLRSRVAGNPSADPRFRNDLNRFLRDLDALQSRLLGLWAELDELYRGSRRDTELAAPAKAVEDAARSLASGAGRMQEEAHSAAAEFQRAGYWVDVWNLERQAGGVSREARHLRTDAGRLRDRVGRQ